MIMIVHPSIPAKTLAEFIDYAKKNPAKLNFGSAGSGSIGQLAGEMFKQQTGVEMTHVPYKGAGAALTDLLSGQIQLMFESVGISLPPVQAGLLRLLGVSSTASPICPSCRPSPRAAIPITASASGMASPRRPRCRRRSSKPSPRASSGRSMTMRSAPC
jgi:tripartite-type tricarboxylate transporter receptor subunit TctC